MTFEKVRDMLANQLNVKAETITAETDIAKDLKADSLDVVEMLMTLEEEFNISVPEEKATALVTVGDVVKLIDSLRS